MDWKLKPTKAGLSYAEDYTGPNATLESDIIRLLTDEPLYFDSDPYAEDTSGDVVVARAIQEIARGYPRFSNTRSVARAIRGLWNMRSITLGG